jgi:molecular chaperone GrpE
MSISGAIARERYHIRALADRSEAFLDEPVAPAKSGVSEEDFILLQQRANQYRQEVAQLKDALVRAKADYDNLRRRSNQERTQLRDQGKEEAVTALLDVVDNFDRAVEASAEHTDVVAIREGIVMVQGLLNRALGDLGLSKIPALGQPFDPNVHEAIGTEPTSEAPDNTVTAVMSAGYKMGDKVIRPAKVIVAKKPA